MSSSSDHFINCYAGKCTHAVVSVAILGFRTQMASTGPYISDAKETRRRKQPTKRYKHPEASRQPAYMPYVKGVTDLTDAVLKTTLHTDCFNTKYESMELGGHAKGCLAITNSRRL